MVGTAQVWLLVAVESGVVGRAVGTCKLAVVEVIGESVLARALGPLWLIGRRHGLLRAITIAGRVGVVARLVWLTVVSSVVVRLLVVTAGIGGGSVVV